MSQESTSQLLARAQAEAARAVAADTAHHPDALGLYQNCVGTFLTLLGRPDLPPAAKGPLMASTRSYLDRAEQLKTHRPASLRHHSSENDVATPGAPPLATQPAALSRSSPVHQVAPPPAYSSAELPPEERSGLLDKLRRSDPGVGGTAWQELFRRVFVADAEEQLHGCYPAKLDGTPPRRGGLFVTNTRLCFCPHARGERLVPPSGDCFVTEEALSVPWSGVEELKREEGYLGLSLRIRVVTRAGSWLLRGLQDRREDVWNAVESALQAARGATRVFGQPLPLDGVPCLVRQCVSEIEERGLNELGLWDDGDEEQQIYVEGVTRALDTGSELDWSALPVEVIAGVLLRFLHDLNPPLLPLTILPSLMGPARAVLASMSEPVRKLLRYLAYFWATLISAENQTDAAAIGSVFAKQLCYVNDPIAVNGVATFLVTLINERRTMFK